MMVVFMVPKYSDAMTRPSFQDLKLRSSPWSWVSLVPTWLLFVLLGIAANNSLSADIALL